MTQTILIIIGIAIIAILLSRKTREVAVGICQVAIGQDAKKQKNKEKILALFSGKPASAQGSGAARELSNYDIREALGISDRSVIRYMDELEKEGKAEQIGNTGRNVTYRLKQ